jgi:phage terminase small subunit
MPRGGGRPTKLDALHALEGTVKRSTKEARNGVKIVALGGPLMPEHLMPDAKACMQIIQESMPPGVYARTDTFLLAAYSTAWAIHKKAVEEMANPDFEWMVERITGPAENERSHWEPNAWIRISNNQAQLMASLGDRLGLDPKARAAIQPLAESKKRGSKFDGLVNARMPEDVEQIGSSSSSSA